MSGPRVVLGLVRDLVFGGKIGAVVQERGDTFLSVRDSAALDQKLSNGAVLVVVNLQLAPEEIRRAAELSKASGVKVIGFFPHVQAELGEFAESLGISAFPRSKFLSRLEEALVHDGLD